jgi:hypothetical protein
MNELLTSASLLLAFLGVLFGVWYPEIIASLHTSVPRHPEDRAKPRREVSVIFLSRGLPLAIATLVAAAVFLPPAINIVANSPSATRATSLAIFLRDYDPVGTAFILVEILTVGLAVYCAVLLIRLAIMLRQLRGA